LPVAPSVKTTTTPKPHEPKNNGIPPVLSTPQNVTPELGANGYVFPVYGVSSYGDTYGALRGDVSGGWHHGDDVFAPLGAPLLAVAHGTVFSVGWNDVGGWRLWLRDDSGNEFYYAHLSAYTPLAVNGAIVNAGDVLGFVGNTGDAEGTPYHLHFEVHPAGLLGLGYDGAVNPTKYLDAWRRLQDVRFDTVVGWAPAIAANAPKAGAILLQSSDISTASGLDPASLERALSQSAQEGGGGLLLPRSQPPASKPVRTAP
jgi:Peptidase family M23